MPRMDARFPVLLWYSRGNMANRLTDTSPEMENAQLAGLRAMPPRRKLQLASDLTVATRQFALAGLRQRYPGAREAELRRRLATIVLGERLANKAYGAQPCEPSPR
jgi:hypothetical protein